MTGYLFGDRYQVGDTLGFGGMSEVHRGRDLRLGRDVAIKVLRADLARDPSFQARFRREAQNAASLNHPAIVAVYDTGETTGESGPIPYIVMEYVEGETLRDLLKREGPLEPKRAMEITADICAALDFSHRHGIVHRDIKPANVMLNRAGAVKVMDFGIARAVSDGQATMTATAAVIGTAQYLSPEQARGEPVDARSDVYATGCVLYELLTGSPPFVGDSPVAIAYQHVRETPKPPSEVRPGLARELDSIVLKALNKNPLNRYQNAAEMRQDLVRALSGQAVKATPLMSDEDRTEIYRATPRSVGAGPSLLAPPTHGPTDQWEPEETEQSRSKRVWGFVGIGALCLALLAGAIWLTLRVTSAPPPVQQVAVPELTGLSADDATARLRDSGLVLGQIANVESTDDKKGQVVEQRPSKLTSVDKGSSVSLDIGEGVRNVDVPNVVTYSPEQAKNALSAANLQYAEVQEASSDADRNKAIRQDPAAQASVAPGTVITVVIGSGPNFVAVPDGLVGLQLADATAQLQALKLTVVSQQAASAEPLNQVLAIDPKPGERIQEGTSVTLTVSDNSQMTMPNLRNLTPDEAAAAMRNVGWSGDRGTLATREVETTNPALVGAVVAQSPASGEVVAKTGTRVSVDIGVQAQAVVPDVRGATEGAARAALANAGLTNVSTTAGPAAPSGDLVGRVQQQSVPGGTQIPTSQRVTITVYQAAAPPTPTTPTTPPTTAPAPSAAPPATPAPAETTIPSQPAG
ncbi:serine/threonine-protein kinase [Nakamurella flavida]|uniref:Stk1 family PASTA domain-containing Ser/Thr kinase n=1 Tax=Nakamurella flavida TaxID=363630 RepID=UPI00278647FD|nr:Stk1 family PASTA domain-containing Ser/Thr kinase [Nakamurella flavida]MDP9778541.1 serine/threonine-protein kinase [Nakamurella flavida]